MENLFQELNLGSFGYLKKQRENSKERGTSLDQRIKDLNCTFISGLYAHIPSVKLYLNLVYNTGLPGVRPIQILIYTSRLNDYRRVDVGL
jgi:hypothetical protein